MRRQRKSDAALIFARFDLSGPAQRAALDLRGYRAPHRHAHTHTHERIQKYINVRPRERRGVVAPNTFSPSRSRRRRGPKNAKRRRKVVCMRSTHIYNTTYVYACDMPHRSSTHRSWLRNITPRVHSQRVYYSVTHATHVDCRYGYVYTASTRIGEHIGFIHQIRMGRIMAFISYAHIYACMVCVCVVYANSFVVMWRRGVSNASARRPTPHGPPHPQRLHVHIYTLTDISQGSCAVFGREVAFALFKTAYAQRRQRLS